MPRSSVTEKKPRKSLRSSKPLQRKTRMRPVSKKRQERRRTATTERLAAVAKAAGEAAARLAPAAAVVPAFLVGMTPDRRQEFVRVFNGPPIEKAREYVSIAIMERLHQLPCRVCGKHPVSLHHFPPGSVVGVRDDRLVVNLCGDGTKGCHGKAQRREIPDEQQALMVGETLAASFSDGLVTSMGVWQALRQIPRHDLRKMVRTGFLHAIGDEVWP